jgi:hypothetical protein
MELSKEMRGGKLKTAEPVLMQKRLISLVFFRHNFVYSNQKYEHWDDT